MRAPLAPRTSAKFFVKPHPNVMLAPGPDSLDAVRSSERMLAASNARPNMNPSVFARRSFGSTRFTGAGTATDADFGGVNGDGCTVVCDGRGAAAFVTVAGTG